MTVQPAETEKSSTRLFESFIQQGIYLRNWSPHTVTTYQRAFASFQQSLREAPASGETERLDRAQGPLSKATLDTWIIWMRQHGLTLGGCNVKIRAINSFLSWLAEEKHLPARIQLKLFRDASATLDAFSAGDVRLMLAFKPQTLIDWRTWALCVLLLDTGLRIDEALQLEQIDFDNLLLTVIGKGRKERRVPFSLECRKTLFRYLAMKEKRGVTNRFLFCTMQGRRLMYRNLYRDLSLFCQRCGVTSHINPHKFRHTFASRFIANGGNPFQLQRIMGHSSIQTTLRYVHLQTADLQQAHAQFSPLVKPG